MAHSLVFVSAAKAGTIDVFMLDAETGALTPRGSCAAGGTVGPTAVSPDGRHLHAVIRSDPPRLRTFAIDRDTGGLTAVADAPLPASMPYASVTADGRFVLTASYADNCAAVTAIGPDGCVHGAPLQIVPTAKHAHAIITDRSGQFAFVPCLGADEIRIFRRDPATGMLTPNGMPSVAAPAGTGPRHAVLSPDNAMLFVIGEFTGDIACYRFDAQSGVLTLCGVTAAVPPEKAMHPGKLDGEKDEKTIWAAELKMSADGRFLYASERTASFIAWLAWDGARLTLKGTVATEKQPRGFGLDPSGRWLIATGEQSDHVAVYAVDRQSGALTPTSRVPVSAGANWVEFSPA